MKSLLPTLTGELAAEKKWQIRETALKCLATFNKTAPKQFNALSELVPETTACMWDAKTLIKKASE